MTPSAVHAHAHQASGERNLVGIFGAGLPFAEASKEEAALLYDPLSHAADPRDRAGRRGMCGHRTSMGCGVCVRPRKDFLARRRASTRRSLLLTPVPRLARVRARALQVRAVQRSAHWA